MKHIFYCIALSVVMCCLSCHNATSDVDLINNPNSANGYDTTVAVPHMVFDCEQHDFGRLTAGESISYGFHFCNKGAADLVISGCEASCGCTVASYPKNRIAPGEEGYITVTFASAGKSGQQVQEVTVCSNSQPSRIKLRILAQVQ